MIFLGVLVAVFLGPTNYNIMDNYISDMGSHRYTPIPKFLDDGVMLTSIMLVPACFYLKKIFDSKSKQLESINVSTKYTSVVLITMLIGMFGIFCAGVFNEDVGISLEPFTIYDLHEVFTVVEFVGTATAGLLIGIILVRFPNGIMEIFGYKKMPKVYPIILGLIMIFLTPILCVFFLLELPPSGPFWEWMLFFSIFGWLMTIGIIILNQIKNDEIIEKKKFHEFLVDPKVVRPCIIFAQIYFPLMIITGYIIAVLLGPGTFNIMDNYISDLGSLRYTPIPKFLDNATMLTSLLLVPISFYIKHMFDSKSKQLESINVSTKYTSVVLITMLIGLFGIFIVGFINEDVAISLYPFTTNEYDLHDIFTVFPQFVGLASAGLLIGIIFVRYPEGIIEITGYKNLSKSIIIIIGLIMIFLTPILTAFFILDLPPSDAFWEWMLFFSIYGWIPPIGIMILHQIKSEA